MVSAGNLDPRSVPSLGRGGWGRLGRWGGGGDGGAMTDGSGVEARGQVDAPASSSRSRC